MADLCWAVAVAAGLLTGCDRGPAAPQPVSAPGATEVSPPKQGDLTPGRLADPGGPQAPQPSGVNGSR